MSDLLKNFIEGVNLLDIFFLIILIYNIIQCLLKGFSLSLISSIKWVLSTVITIILVPKLQPLVSDYVQSEFINNLGLGIAIFIFTLFVTILIGKTLSKTVIFILYKDLGLWIKSLERNPMDFFEINKLFNHNCCYFIFFIFIYDC